MLFKEAMLARRSVRRYNGKKIPEEDFQQILLAGLLCPSSRNFKSTELIVVEKTEDLEKLSHAKAGGNMLLQASHAIVVIGNSEKSDAWIEDGSIAMTQMMLRAADLGVGTCWIHCRNRDSVINEDGNVLSSESYVRQLLHIPEGYSVLAILSLGIPDTAPTPHTEDEADPVRVHTGQF